MGDARVAKSLNPNDARFMDGKSKGSKWSGLLESHTKKNQQDFRNSIKEPTLNLAKDYLKNKYNTDDTFLQGLTLERDGKGAYLGHKDHPNFRYGIEKITEQLDDNEQKKFEDFGRDIRKKALVENFNRYEVKDPVFGKLIKEEELNNLTRIGPGVYNYQDSTGQDRTLKPGGKGGWDGDDLDKKTFIAHMESVEGDLKSLGFDFNEKKGVWKSLFGPKASETELPSYAEESVRKFAAKPERWPAEAQNFKIERDDKGKIYMEDKYSHLKLDDLRKTDNDGGNGNNRADYQQIGYDMRRQAFADNLNRLRATKRELPIEAEDIRNLKKLDDGTYSYEYNGAKYGLRQEDINGYDRNEAKEFKDQMDKADKAISSLGFGIKNKIPEATEKAVLENATQIRPELAGGTVIDYNRDAGGTGEWYIQKDGEVHAYKPDSEAAEQIKDDAEKHAFMKHAGDNLTWDDGTAIKVDDVFNVVKEKDGTYTVHGRWFDKDGNMRIKEGVKIDKDTQNKIDADRGILDIDKSGKKSIFDMRYRSDLIEEKEEALTRLKRKVKWIKWGINTLDHANAIFANAGQSFDAAFLQLLHVEGGGQQQQQPATIEMTHAVAKSIRHHYENNVKFAKKELAILKEHPEHANMMRQLKDLDAKMRHQYEGWVDNYNLNQQDKSNHLPANLSDLSFDEI